jgi:hypothetical protein
MCISLAFGHPDLLAQIAKVETSYDLNRVAIAPGATRARLSERLTALGYDVLPSAASSSGTSQPPACATRSGSRSARTKSSIGC